MRVSEHPPSQAWERCEPGPGLPHGLWVWCRPPQAPQAILVRIPPETYQDPATAQSITMRRVCAALGLTPPEVFLWNIGGAPYEGRQGTNPLFDAPLPPARPGTDPTIAVTLAPAPAQYAAQPPPAQVPPSQPVQQAAAAPENVMAKIDRIADDWHNSLLIEKQLEASRNQLHGTIARLNSLNRDLSADERLYGDRQDKTDWQEARRWVREASVRLSKMIKDHDIGIASAAGRRNQYETVYQQYIVPRQPCPGLDAFQREFEAHRKTVQHLLMQMTLAQNQAIQDGERRAQQVLARITAKVRIGRNRR